MTLEESCGWGLIDPGLSRDWSFLKADQPDAG